MFNIYNTINVSKVIYKCRVPILLLPVSNLSSSLTLSTFTSLTCNNASPLVYPRPLLFCSIALDAPRQIKIVHMVQILLTWLVECGRFRKCLGNNPGLPK